MPRNTTIPDLLLERLALGELPPERAQALRQRLDNDEAARTRLAEIERGHAEFLTTHPPDRALREIAARAAASRSRQRSWRWTLPALALATVALIFLLRPPRQLPDVTRDKGLAPHLIAFRQSAQVAGGEELRDGATVRAHEVIQLGYVAAGKRYGAVLSLDGRGGVTLHFPARATDPPQLVPHGGVLLPSAYELDDSPRFERFVLITADRPFSVTAALAAAHVVAANPAAARVLPLPLSAALGQTSLVLQKVER